MASSSATATRAESIAREQQTQKQQQQQQLQQQACVEVTAPAGGLHGAHIRLRFPSVGATETLMMAAACAHGTTTITNAAREPEIVELAGLINAMGGDVAGAGGDTVVVRGRGPSGLACAAGVLSGPGSIVEHRVSPDRIEAGTLLMAGAITGTCEAACLPFLLQVCSRM